MRTGVRFPPPPLMARGSSRAPGLFVFRGEANPRVLAERGRPRGFEPTSGPLSETCPTTEEPTAAAGGRHSPRLHSWPGALPEPRVFVSFGRGGACLRLAVRVRGRERGHHVASGPTRAGKRSGPFNPGASHDHDRTPRPRTGTPRPTPGFTTPGGGRAPRPGGVHSFSG